MHFFNWFFFNWSIDFFVIKILWTLTDSPKSLDPGSDSPKNPGSETRIERVHAPSDEIIFWWYLNLWGLWVSCSEPYLCFTRRCYLQMLSSTESTFTICTFIVCCWVTKTCFLNRCTNKHHWLVVVYILSVWNLYRKCISLYSYSCKGTTSQEIQE